MKKFLNLLLSIAIISTLFLTGCSTKESNQKEIQSTSKVEAKVKNINDNLRVHFIDVGQADSILVQQGGQAMLIDAGNNADDKTVKAYLDSVGVKDLAVVIGTHPHEDHIGGLDYIMNSLKVGKIYIPKATSTTKTFQDLVTATKNAGLQFTVPSVGTSFNLGQAKCTILAPNGENYEDVNDYSIVIKVEFGTTSFLLTGDAEAISEMEMVKANANLKVDVLKVGHHGSKSSTCANFLKAVSPKYAVISVGKDNDYGHPAQSTMDRLKGAGVQVFRTDESGTVVATSNGKDISFNCNPSTKAEETNTSENVNEPAKETIVYWTNSGKSYHSTKSCKSLSRSKNILEGPASSCPKTDPCNNCVQ